MSSGLHGAIFIMINVVFFSFLFPKIKKILILGNRRGVIMLKEGVLMKLMERNDYLEKVINAIGTPDIKVITGVRRSGKSKLLEAFKSYVNANIENANILCSEQRTWTMEECLRISSQ